MVDIYSQPQLEDELRNVERDQNGVIVLSPYGFTIKEIRGKRYVVCRTEEEYNATRGGTSTSALNLQDCQTGSNGICVQDQCTQQCYPIFNGYWVCYCPDR